MNMIFMMIMIKMPRMISAATTITAIDQGGMIGSKSTGQSMWNYKKAIFKQA